MTSSYANIIGTPRDQIPDISDTNYGQDPYPDLSEKTNEDITKNKEELKSFLTDLGEIQKQTFEDSLNNLDLFKGFIKEADNLAQVREANKESRETLKRFRELDDKTKEKLNQLEDIDELDDAGLHEILREIAINEETGEVDEQAFEFLKLKYFKTGDEINLEGVNNTYIDHASSAFNSNIEDNFLYSAATEVQANAIADRAITNILTKYYVDLAKRGIDINSKEAQRFINRQLLPELVKQQITAISRYKDLTTRRYFANVERKKDSFILSAINTSSVVTRDDGTNEIVYNGNLDNALLKIQKIDGVNKQDALQILLDRLPSLKNQLTPGGLEYLLGDVKIEHSSGVTIVGLDSELADDLIKGNRGNVVQLKRLLSEVTRTKDDIAESINKKYENKFLEFAKVNNGQHMIETANGENKVMEEIDAYRTEMKQNGFDLIALEIPSFFFGDETTTTSTAYSIKETSWKNINDRAWDTDWTNAIGTDGEKPLDGTKDMQIAKAKQWLKTQLEIQRASTPSFDENAFIALKYDEVIEKLKNGDFKPNPNDFIILPTAENLLIEKDNFLKDPNKWMSNTEVNSLEEKQALLAGIEWRNNNYRGPIPGYFTTVGTANGETGMQYLMTRLKALNMWDEKDENFRNPEEALGLSDEDLKTLALRTTYTKNHLYLNTTDDDRTAENKVLNILRKGKENRKIDHVGVKSGMFGGVEMLGEWLLPGTEVRTVGRMYEMALSGKFDDFGIYGLTSEELIQAVESGVVSVDDDFDENTQDFLALNLVRVKANQTKGIEGAVTEGYDWRRLVNLSRADKIAVLKFFPNLQGMTANQFQDLLPDISLAILSDVEKQMKNIEEGVSGVEGKPEYGTFSKEYIEANPEFSFMNLDISEENLQLELEDNAEAIVEFVYAPNKTKFFGSGQENEVRAINLRLFFQKRIEEGKPVPLSIRQMLQATKLNYLNVPMTDKTSFLGFGDFPRYTDKFDYIGPEENIESYEIGYDKEKFKLIMGEDGNYKIVPREEKK